MQALRVLADRYPDALWLVHCQSGQLVFYFFPLTMMLQFAIVWLTVIVSLERWLAICLPFVAKRWLTRARSHIAIGLVFLASLIYGIPRFFEYVVKPVVREREHKNGSALAAAFASVSHAFALAVANDSRVQDAIARGGGGGWSSRWSATTPNQLLLGIEELNSTSATATSTRASVGCNTFDKSEFSKNPIVMYVLLLGSYVLLLFLIPVVLITLANIALIREIVRSRRRWSSLTRSQQRQQRMTRLPICIVVLFYVLALPALVINVIDTLDYPPIAEFKKCTTWGRAIAVANFLVILNSALNFVIYYANGHKFRRQFLDLFGGRRFKRYSIFGSSVHAGPNGTQNALNLEQQATSKSALPYIERLKRNASDQAATHNNHIHSRGRSHSQNNNNNNNHGVSHNHANRNLKRDRTDSTPSSTLRPASAASRSASREPSARFGGNEDSPSPPTRPQSKPQSPPNVPRRDSRYMMLVPPTGTIELALTGSTCTGAGTPDTARTLLDANSCTGTQTTVASEQCSSRSAADMCALARDLTPIDADASPHAINRLFAAAADEQVAAARERDAGSPLSRKRLTQIVSVSFYDLPVSPPSASPSGSDALSPDVGTRETHDL